MHRALALSNLQLVIAITDKFVNHVILWLVGLFNKASRDRALSFQIRVSHFIYRCHFFIAPKWSKMFRKLKK